MGRVLGSARQHKDREGDTRAAPCSSASEVPCNCCRPACMLQVCCEVLQRVRQEAEARNAGIIFLGKHLTPCCCHDRPLFQQAGAGRRHLQLIECITQATFGMPAEPCL